MNHEAALQVAGYSLLEMLISLVLAALILTLLATASIQTARMWSELQEEECLINEGRTLLQMISRDLKSASLCSENLYIDLPLTSCQKNIFFLRRTSNDDLITVGYFIDPNKKNQCYRFFANAHETLTAMSNKNLARIFHTSHSEAMEKADETRRRQNFDRGGMSTYRSDQNSTITQSSSALAKLQTERYEISGLAELESRAAPGEAHCELIAKHLLSWEMIPVWNNKNKMILLEINLSLGKTTPRYFLSTVVALEKQ